MENKFKANGEVMVNDIMHEIKTTYSTRITWWAAWKARKIAKQAMEGDVVNQFKLLWQYFMLF